MAETKHSPGPWTADLDSPIAAIPGHIVRVGGFAIALLWKGGGTHGVSRQRANALLIAAAPELLESLAELVAAIDALGTVKLPRMERARAAITKAHGG
jgi:hypothetical protein